jgi:hypothetical protein
MGSVTQVPNRQAQALQRGAYAVAYIREVRHDTILTVKTSDLSQKQQENTKKSSGLCG